MLLLLLVSLVPIVQSTSTPWKYNGTSPGLENIILGRCYQFKEINHLNRLEDFSISVSCAKLWKEFHSSFANKDICNVTEKDYDGLFALMNNKKKSDQLLFWSGTRTIVHDFSYVNDNYVTLEDTFPGYLANSLRWCGCKNCSSSGIDYKRCNSSCPNNAYWSRASRNLAEKASGTAYVLVNGTARGYFTAYYSGSFFATVELPKLGRMKQVKELVILVALDLHVKPKEKCGEGTLIDLVSDAKKYGIPEVKCYENPVMVMGILCAKYPHARLCKRVKPRNWKMIAVVFICVCVAFLAAIFALCIVLRKLRWRFSSSDIAYNNEELA